jgi:hypothetical protein
LLLPVGNVFGSFRATLQTMWSWGLHGAAKGR